jgi:hypothetical protein
MQRLVRGNKSIEDVLPLAMVIHAKKNYGYVWQVRKQKRIVGKEFLS